MKRMTVILLSLCLPLPLLLGGDEVQVRMSGDRHILYSLMLGGTLAYDMNVSTPAVKPAVQLSLPLYQPQVSEWMIKTSRKVSLFGRIVMPGINADTFESIGMFMLKMPPPFCYVPRWFTNFTPRQYTGTALPLPPAGQTCWMMALTIRF